MKKLEDMVVLVTGGGGGLGKATCQVLAGAGAKVIIGEIRALYAKTAAEEINKTGGKAEAIELDVGNWDDAKRLVDYVADKYGGLDALVNNAGIDITKPIEELTIEEWDEVIRVNLRGPFIMSKLAFEKMKDKGGQIVNICSTAAKRAWANASAYHASKWGLLGLSRGLHVEGRKFGIKVTAVVAGGMKTPFLLDRFPDIDQSLLQDPVNVAETIKFVLSQPAETVVAEIMTLPVYESSWP